MFLFVCFIQASYFSVNRKSKRWQLRPFFHLTRVNAYIIYVETLKRTAPDRRPMEQLDFLTNIVENLIGDFTSRKLRVPVTVGGVPAPARLTERHFQVDLRDHGHPRKRRCVVCKRRAESCFGCLDCGVHLCQPGSGGKTCFQEFHSVANIVYDPNVAEP